MSDAAPQAASAGHPLIIGFDWDSNSLSKYGVFTLDQLAKRLLTQPYGSIVIRGYSDSLGGDNYNKNLSLFRATIVKSYLMAKGIPSETMVTLGLGAENPLATNDTVEGRRKNRRVEIEVRP